MLEASGSRGRSGERHSEGITVCKSFGGVLGAVCRSHLNIACLIRVCEKFALTGELDTRGCQSLSLETSDHEQLMQATHVEQFTSAIGAESYHHNFDDVERESW